MSKPITNQEAEASQMFIYASLGQAIYYALTGIWALVSIGTFQKVTGPKVDTWLVKTVGALVIVIGGVLGMAGLRKRATPEVPVLAVGSALALTGIDVVYVARKRISPVYLLDALGELMLVGMWVLALRQQRRDSTEKVES
jgi:hypothetical protein